MKDIFNVSKMPRSKEVYDLPRAKDYSCPNCGIPAPEYDLWYIVDKKRYPLCYNESKGWNGDQYHDWDEVHKCKGCKTEYYYSNGAY